MKNNGTEINTHLFLAIKKLLNIIKNDVNNSKNSFNSSKGLEKGSTILTQAA